MNERIQELAKQATENILGVDILNQQKFAELIIQECAEIADFCKQEESIEDVSSVLRRHFGVK